MNIQDLCDAISEGGRIARGDYHMTLGGLMKLLEAAAPDLAVVTDQYGPPGHADSYRGYYSDLAFEPSGKEKTTEEFFGECRLCLDNEFEGYKGGTFKMDHSTPLWIAEYGQNSQIGIMDVKIEDGKFILVTKVID